MTIEEYRSRIDITTKGYKAEIDAIKKQFAFANAKYKVGDIIASHRCKIKVAEIKYYSGSFSSDLPIVIYEGVELRKDNKPKKNGNISLIWETNVKEKI